MSYVEREFENYYFALTRRIDGRVLGLSEYKRYTISYVYNIYVEPEIGFIL